MSRFAPSRRYPALRPLARLAELRDRAFAGGGHLPLVALLIVAGLLAHGFNMFYNPTTTRLDDEGIYMAQAWAVLREGRLAPYTYWYDHAPAGWIFLAGWMALTGGPLTFGSAVDGGRVLMLLLHLAMVPLLYRLATKLGAGAPAAALGALVFSLSPLAIFYQRFVLLDTIMMFWILLSIELLLDGWGRLSRFALSGICFGIAALSKETAVFLLPAMLLLAWQQRREHHGRFALLGWLVPMGIVISWYPLYAAIKGELLPAGQSIGFFVLGSDHPQVSLSESLRWQATRTGGGLLNFDNQFWRIVRTDWMVRDPLLTALGALATAVSLVRGIRDRRLLLAGLLGALPLFYLGRGGVVFDFYVLFAIPFLCLNLALLVQPLLARLPAPAAAGVVAGMVALMLGAHLAAGRLQPLYVEQPAAADRESLAWLKASLPPESRIVLRDGFWTDMHEPGHGGPAFPHAHSHWKVAADPEIRGGLLKEDWRNIDYLLITPELVGDFRATGNQLAIDALANASLVRRWERDGTLIELHKVNHAGATERALLEDGAESLRLRFAQGGAFPDAEGRVTSEAQSYAMLRAAWSGNREEFDAAWAWTQRHLLNEAGLPSWLWQGGAVTDAHTASDATTDTALALLMAGRRWEDPALLAAGTRMVRAIWEQEVTTIGGRPYLAAGDWARDGDPVAVNPSYLAPYAYRIFAEVDPEHDWLALVDSSYDLLFAASRESLGAARTTGLPPDWVGVDRASGRLVRLELEKGDTAQYGWDAARTYWRVALDGRWSGDGRATAYLELAGFLRDEMERKGFVSAVYGRDGAIVQEAPSAVSTAGAMAALLTLDPPAAHRLHATMLGEVRRNGRTVTWGRPLDLYEQEWGWFGTAMYADALPDLWRAPRAAGTASS